MNLYTISYEATQPTQQAITVPLNSKYAVGVGLTYEGKEVNVLKDQTTLDGISADGYLNGMAVFNLSSDGNEGRTDCVVNINKLFEDKHPALSVCEKHETIDSPELISGCTSDGTTTFYIQFEMDISEWANVTISCDDNDTRYDNTYNPWMCPFAPCSYLPDGTKDNEISSYDGWQETIFVTYRPDGMRMPYAYYGPRVSGIYKDGKRTKNYIYCTFFNDNKTTKSNTLTIKPNTHVIWSGKPVGNPPSSSHPQVGFEGSQPIAYSGNFKLYIDKKDVGRAEGYLDVTNVYNGTINLSGTLSDDTEFSYDLPIKD